MPSILFVFTSNDKTLRDKQTGWFLPEAAHPYYVLAPHVNIDFASPKGPNPPVDNGSIEAFKSDNDSIKFLEDPVVKGKFEHAKKLSDVNPKDYDAIFYVGGHGPTIDLPTDPINIQLANEFYRSGKIVSAVCHGPAALVGATDASGQSIFSGRTVTGFSNFEEEKLGAVEDVPFLLQSRLESLGAKYEKATEPWGVKVVVDGKIITGQNPASAGPIGRALLQALNIQA